MPATDRTAPTLIGVAVLLLGAVRAGDTAFHLDESHTAVSATQTFGELVGQLRDEAGMAPYYLALWAWRHLGTSELWLRMLSVTGAALTAALSVVVARRITNGTITVIATIALVCNPFFLRNLTELRGYSWSMALALLATLAIWRVLRAPTKRNGAIYGMAVGLLLALLSFATGVVLAQAMHASELRRDRRARRSLIIAAGVASIVVLATLPALLTSDQVDWIEPTTPYKIAAQTATALGGPVWALALALGNVCFIVMLLRRRFTRHERELRLVLWSTILVPAMLLSVSLLKPLYEARYLAPGLPFAVLGAATGVVMLIESATADERWRRAGVAGLLVVCAVGFPGRPATDIARSEDQRLAAEAVKAGLRVGDAIVYAPGWLEFSMRYYLSSDTATAFLDPGARPGRARPTLTERTVDEFCRVWVLRRPGPESMPLAEGLLAANPEATTDNIGNYEVSLVDRC